jgi:hypothetical protein
MKSKTFRNGFSPLAVRQNASSPTIINALRPRESATFNLGFSRRNPSLASVLDLVTL